MASSVFNTHINSFALALELFRGPQVHKLHNYLVSPTLTITIDWINCGLYPLVNMLAVLCKPINQFRIVTFFADVFLELHLEHVVVRASVCSMYIGS